MGGDGGGGFGRGGGGVCSKGRICFRMIFFCGGLPSYSLLALVIGSF